MRNVIEAVFLTMELLERVLILLPMKDLLLAQRVCRKWRSVIRESTELQEALFLSPKLPDSLLRRKSEEDNGERFVKVDNGPPSGRCTGGSKAMVSGYVNPLFFHEFGSEDWDGIHHTGHINFRPNCVERPLSFDTKRTLSEGTEESWKRMFISQPPCSKAEICCLIWIQTSSLIKLRQYWGVIDTQLGELTITLPSDEKRQLEYKIDKHEGVTVFDVVQFTQKVRSKMPHVKVDVKIYTLSDVILPSSEEKDALDEHEGE